MIPRNNILEMKSITRLLDGRCFFIPSYQRGYRWGKEQVEDLLEDLYTFSKKADKNGNSFYCLQPVVVKEMPNDLTGKQNPQKKYEVIDGQQRLTTLYILFNFLMKEEDVSPEKLEKRRGLKTFTIDYETRTNNTSFLENLSGKPATIDEYFMQEALSTINKWFTEKAPNKYKDIIGNIEDAIWNLFDDTKSNNPVIKVIWYEIDPSKDVAIDEFLKLNTGKISLTDTELVKALFLQNRGEKSESAIDQIALEWEHIENAFCKDDFWSFLSADKCDKSHKMEFLLRLYMSINMSSQDQGIYGNRLEHILFDYFYRQFESFDNNLEQIQSLWNSILEMFRMLSGWYDNPILYNYIGYLTQSGVSIEDIYKDYEDVKVTTNDDFIRKIKVRIADTLKAVKIKDDSISNTYDEKGEGGRKTIVKCLLLLNIDYLNRQLESLRESNASNEILSPAYKFPFDLYVSQKWNVEHIDSATTNGLNSTDDKISWLETNLTDLGEKDNSDIRSLIDNKNYDEAICKVKEMAGEADDDDKMDIGNLTLLDEKTNKGYGNDLFIRKRNAIFDNVLNGRYVMPCTQLVFAKTFTGSTTKLTRWSKEDKQNYGKFIYDRIKNYLK